MSDADVSHAAQRNVANVAQSIYTPPPPLSFINASRYIQDAILVDIGDFDGVEPFR